MYIYVVPKANTKFLDPGRLFFFRKIIYQFPAFYAPIQSNVKRARY